MSFKDNVQCKGASTTKKNKKKKAEKQSWPTTPLTCINRSRMPIKLLFPSIWNYPHIQHGFPPLAIYHGECKNIHHGVLAALKFSPPKNPKLGACHMT